MSVGTAKFPAVHTAVERYSRRRTLTKLITRIVSVQERHLSLRVHEALMKARIPCYLEACESSDGNSFRGLTGVKDKFSRFVDGGVARVRRVRAW
jgi:hypothetical protein